MNGILKDLLAEGKLRRHRTSPQEIANLFDLVDRDIGDASVQGLSADRRCAIAYEAALNPATITLYCRGYRTHGHGHHFHTFQALRETMGPEGVALADYLDMCRTKRASTVYDRAGGVSDQEASELLEQVGSFRLLVQEWRETNYPGLSRGQ